MNTFERRMEIIDILSERRQEQIKNLAFELNVTGRTIQNDIYELSLTYPIDTKRGKGGCVFVQEGFTLRRRFLAEKEKSLLEKLAVTLPEEDAATILTIVKSFGKRSRER